MYPKYVQKSLEQIPLGRRFKFSPKDKDEYTLLDRGGKGKCVKYLGELSVENGEVIDTFKLRKAGGSLFIVESYHRHPELCKCMGTWHHDPSCKHHVVCY